MRFAIFVLGWMLASSLVAQTVVVEKPEFSALVAGDAKLERIATGFQFLEGPAWDPRYGDLIFSDIPANHLYALDISLQGSPPRIWRDPSNHANGNTYNLSGDTLFTCEHGTRRVTFNGFGGVETLVDRFEGKPFNSPNDLAVKRDHTVWFSDPTYGLEGRLKEQATNRVYCIDYNTREIHAVASDFDQPNGLCFSPDETRLYVADSGKPHHVRVFDVTRDNMLTNSRVFCVIEPGVPDGMRCDGNGNLWSSAGDGIHVYNPAGERIGKILVPETPANLCFGRHDLYITARKSLYRIKVLTTGITAPP